jgi:hypothetical protein
VFVIRYDSGRTAAEKQGENRPRGQPGQPASGRVDLDYKKGPWKIPEWDSIFKELFPFFPPPLKIEHNLIILVF